MVESMLILARERGWALVDFEDIAKAANVDIDDAHEYFDDKGDILAAYGRKIDRQILDNIVEDESLTCRDKLFDLMMERFDALNEEREAVVAILDGFRGDPKEAVLSFPHLGRSMSRTLEASGIETDGIFGAAKVLGLVGIYLYVVRTWKEDDSADMAKTMAALDKALDRSEQIYEFLPLKP